MRCFDLHRANPQPIGNQADVIEILSWLRSIWQDVGTVGR